MKKIPLIVSLFVSALAFSNEPPTTKTQYKENYKGLAIKQKQLYNIPASITIAQGILESGSGNSELAKKHNNHFGIKCHSDWSGEKAFFNDDKENECFRSYKKVEDSYLDHSLFLSKHARYKSLFELNTTDYKAWAHGLKSAGYATNPNYASSLINIIEELKLYELDVLTPQIKPIIGNSFEAEIEVHENKVIFVKSKKGDSYYKISKRHGITLHQLHKYNEKYLSMDILEEGTSIYLAPRRNHSRVKKYLVLDLPMTLREIAQKEAVKLKPLMRKNEIYSPDEKLPIGEKIFLR